MEYCAAVKKNEEVICVLLCKDLQDVLLLSENNKEKSMLPSMQNSREEII